jgi:hypothetical protein
VVARIGNKVINKRYSTDRALAKWRSEIIADLGGQDNVSTQQAAVVDLACKSKFLLNSIDVWLFSQKSLINKKKNPSCLWFGSASISRRLGRLWSIHGRNGA